ncbi:MAG: hypothetical protein U0359_13600 [Byssovorax sp.]
MRWLRSMTLVLVSVGCGGSTSGTAGAGGAATTATTTGAGGAGGSSATVTTTGSGGGGTCSPACDLGFFCCDGACVNTANDIKNCGSCGHACLGDNPYCGAGTCADPPCDAVVVCKGSEFCCGSTCCAEGMLCCDVQGPGPSGGPVCAAPENGTCPRGCPTCE